MKHLRRVLPYLRPYRRIAASSVALIFIGSVVSLLTPWPMKILVDYVLANKPLPYGLNDVLGPLASNQMLLLFLTVLAGFLITVLVYAIGVVDNYVNTKLDLRIALDFRTDLFEHA